jgi:hypothetical protein
VSDDEPEAAQERRGNPRLRAVFAEAYDVLAPFFDPANTWAGHSLDQLAYHALRDRFPELTQQDVMILLIAAQRVFSSGTTPTL